MKTTIIQAKRPQLEAITREKEKSLENKGICQAYRKHKNIC